MATTFTMVLGKKTSLPALLLETPQLASLMVFRVMVLPLLEMSFREMAVLVVFTSELVCTSTPFAELRLTAVCVELMLLEVAFTLGPALWKESPSLTREMVLLVMVPPWLGPKPMPWPLKE